jgi:hypothetical protein
MPEEKPKTSAFGKGASASGQKRKPARTGFPANREFKIYNLLSGD